MTDGKFPSLQEEKPLPLSRRFKSTKAHHSIRAIYHASQLQSERIGSILQLDMFCTCIHHFHMSKMIQVRNVPDNLHRSLKAKAALAGMSLSDFLLAEIRQLAERPTMVELRERLRRRSPMVLPVSAAQAVRRERDTR